MTNSCEVCGNREAKFIILIQGAKLTACPVCAREGKILFALTDFQESQELVSFARPPRDLREEEAPVENFGKIMREARNKKGIKIDELAMQINEKASYLEHIERESTTPPLKVLKKIEKSLEIKLVEKSSPSLVDDTSHLKQSQKKDFTLADALEFEKNKKKK
ncbi:MAG: multiprotein-bridging factor 1 family protein [Candidatus Micrarchaeia archaeon]